MKKRYAKLLVAVAGSLASFAMIAPAVQAETLNPGYTQFYGCPNPFLEGNSKIKTCLITEISGGHFQMGNKDVPINKTLRISGGLENELKGFKYNSEGGLSKVELEVPGGLVGLTGLDWLVNLLTFNQLKLYAVTELAGTPEFKGLSEAQLPIKVHLINPVLGNKCYVGSDENPIVLNLTTGTTEPPGPNEPISGTPAIEEFEPELEIFELIDGTFVDNAFAAPGAKGCMLNLGLLSINIDTIVNAASGLPSAAGTNETTQDFDGELVNAKFPYQ